MYAENDAATWIPYFDSVDAIIFLAPISAFNQVLTESPRVNRLEDSVLLWKSICSNKLLGTPSSIPSSSFSHSFLVIL